MTRDDALKRVSSERDYQETIWGKEDFEGRTFDNFNTVAHFILYAENYLAKAKEALLITPETKGDMLDETNEDFHDRIKSVALHRLTQVAALCVAALEKLGA